MYEENVGCEAEGLDTHDSVTSRAHSALTHLEGNTGEGVVGCNFEDERVVMMLTSLGVLCT
jgi:hypothetical protein